MARRARTPANYAEQTHASPWWIVRYAHHARAAAAIRMIAEHRPRIVVDWGAGDGLVLERLLEEPHPPELAIAFEPDPGMRAVIEERRTRSALGDRIRVFERATDLERFLDGRRVDVIACLGVLEHLPLAPRLEFYDVARRTLAPGGSLVLDVPVEIGPAVLVKELGRRLLKGRPPEYTIGQLLRRAVGRTDPDPERFAADGSEEFIVLHKGFDHRLLAREVAERFTLTDRRTTPIGWLPSWACNQEVILRATLPPERAGAEVRAEVGATARLGVGGSGGA